MSIKLKTFVLLVKFVTAVIICRLFGSLMRDIAGNYEQFKCTTTAEMRKVIDKMQESRIGLAVSEKL